METDAVSPLLQCMVGLREWLHPHPTSQLQALSISQSVEISKMRDILPTESAAIAFAYCVGEIVNPKCGDIRRFGCRDLRRADVGQVAGISNTPPSLLVKLRQLYINMKSIRPIFGADFIRNSSKSTL